MQIIENAVYMGAATPGQGGGSAPTYYIEKTVDANGKLINSGNSLISFNGVTDIGEYVLCAQYKDASFPVGTIVDMSSVTQITGQHACEQMFSGSSNIISADLSCLTFISGASACAQMFYGCFALTNIDLSSLRTLIGSGICGYMFSMAGLTSISFPALTNNSFVSTKNQFNNLIANKFNCTIHFPSNLNPQGGSTTISSLTGYPNFGGTNTVLAFDLPATNHLIGADTVEYERSPKFDTATALAWRVNGTNVTATTYYTSTTNNPQVGDTIYSDSACTTAVTTIGSIA